MGIRLRAAERRAQLLGVARRLFARDGYRGASMESIAEAAGVTKPVLYQHFSSKRALYSALLANDLGRLTQELEAAFSQAEDNEERLRRGFGPTSTSSTATRTPSACCSPRPSASTPTSSGR